jgi:hypothetical protein
MGNGEALLDDRGLAANLQEAAAWLVLPKRMREYLAPCVLISPGLVLVQERVELFAPGRLATLQRDTSAELDAVDPGWIECIDYAWRELGFGGIDDTVRLGQLGHLQRTRRFDGLLRDVPADQAGLGVALAPAQRGLPSLRICTDGAGSARRGRARPGA